MSFRLKFILTLLLLFLAGSAGYAQSNHINFFHLNRNDGLSDNQVFSIVKDKKGYMWFGTSNGLNRYDGYQFQNYYASDDSISISGNTINKLYVANDGTLWIGLAGTGLCRYVAGDNTFLRFDMVQEKWLYEANNVIGFAETGDSVLYAGTDFGLFRFNGESGQFELFDPALDQVFDSLSQGYLNSQVQAICTDDKGGLWIAGSNREISYYNPLSKQFRKYNASLPFKEDRALISSMIYLNGRLWIGGLGVAFSVLEPESGQVEELLPELDIVVVNDIKANCDQELMLATGNGFFIYDPESRDVRQYYQKENDSRSLGSTATLSVFEDRDLSLYWVSSYNSGINYAFKDKPFNHMEYGPDTYFNIAFREVTAITDDLKGNIWLGYSVGQIELHNVSDLTKTVVPVKSLFDEGSVGTIFKIFAPSDGNIYCASWRGGIQKLNRSRMRFEPLFGSSEKYLRLVDATDIRDIEMDSKGRLWATAHGKGLLIIDPNKEEVTLLRSMEDNSGISNDWVFQVSLEGDSVAWVTSGWGLNKVSMDDFSVKHYFSYDGTYSLIQSNLQFSTVDAEGRLWVAGLDGLNLYDRDRDGFFRFNRENGLIFDRISALFLCADSSYWCSTSEGVITFRLDWKQNDSVPVLQDVRTFDQHDGLQSDYFISACGILDGDGTIYFGGSHGVDFFDPMSITAQYMEPSILINRVSIMGNTVYPGSPDGPSINSQGEIVFDYRDRMIGIEYLAMNYFKNKGNSYSYKLEPLNQEYIETGANRNLLFTSLSPGHYQLSLKVVLENKEEYESKDVLSIYIKAPFWKKDWFYAIFVLFIVLLLIVIINWYTANLRTKKIQLERVIQNRTRELTKKNRELEDQARILSETNQLLNESKSRIANQAEELRAQSEQLEVVNKDLRVANSMKDKFFSIVAHDLKNPFSTIMGFVELLQNQFDTQSDEDKKKFLGYLHESISTAYKLLENLLQWSRTQSGHLKVDIQMIPVKPIIMMNVKIIEPRIIQKQLELSADVEDGLYVKADQELVSTVLRNLLSNAVKYTSTGGKIGLKVFKSTHGVIHFEVSDTGHGMTKEELAKVLRIDAHMQRQGTEGETGTGLGILLCKEFIEKMNGVFILESEQGKGTTAVFTLPSF